MIQSCGSSVIISPIPKSLETRYTLILNTSTMIKKQKQNIEMYIPVKAIKEKSEQGRQRQKAYNDLFSTAVSKIR